MDANEAITKLEEMGYFKFVDPASCQKAKELSTDYLKKGYLGYFDFEKDPDSYSSVDKRTYRSDTENLAEGDVGRVINQMKEVLAKEGVTITDYKDVTDGNTYDVVINGETFPVFRPENKSGSEAHKALARIVNTLLEKAGSKERLFMVAGGNDGRVILLNGELFNYINSLHLDKQMKPFLA